MEYIIFLVIGIIYGALYSVLFIRMDESWKKIISASTQGGILWGTFYGLGNSLNITKEQTNNLFGTFIISFLLAFIIVFIIVCNDLKKQTDTYKIRVTDIVFGHKKLLDNYYANRQKEINGILNYEKLKDMKKELEDNEKKQKEHERLLKEKEEIIKSNMEKNPYIVLPENYNFPINNAFMNEIPYYIECLNRFVVDFEKLTEQFLQKSKNYKNKEYRYLTAYFIGLCNYISNHFFDAYSVRIHIRYLNGNNYEKLIVCIGNVDVKDSLTPIKYGEGMIYQSSRVRRSLIKSLNNKYHVATKNDAVWEDYMTFSMDKFCLDEKPFLAMGISVKNREHYKSMLYFLNFCRLENIIQNGLNKINEKCEIINIINNIHKEGNNDKDDNKEAI